MNGDVLDILSGETSTATQPKSSTNQSAYFSDTSSECAVNEGMNDKIQNCKILIVQLQREVLFETVKNQGLQTVISSTKELKEENIKLRQDIQNKDRAVSILQNRLRNVGENTSVTLQDDEVLILGLSKQTLLSLSEENCKLKESLLCMSLDPTHVDQLTKANKMLLTQHSNLSQKLRQFEQENKYFKTVIEASDDLKDKEILMLKGQIEELQNGRTAQSILCQSLTDQAEDLRTKLGRPASQCEDMKKKLRATLLDTEQFLASGSMAHTSVLVSTNNSEKHYQDTEVQTLQALVAKKTMELNEVVEMNSCWQKYNSQREEYVQKLHRNIKGSDDQLAKYRQQNDGISEDQQAEIDRIILQGKQKIELVEEEKQKIEDENRHLSKEIRNLEQIVRLRDDEIHTLQQNIQALSNQESHQPSVSDKERIEILEHQIKICTDDFQQERNDREKAIAKIVDLETELEFYKRQLQTIQPMRMQQFGQRRTQALNQYQNQYNQTHRNGNMIPRGIGSTIVYQSDGVEEDGAYGEDVIDGASAEILQVANEHHLNFEKVLPAQPPSRYSPPHMDNHIKAMSDSQLQKQHTSAPIASDNVSNSLKPQTEPGFIYSGPFDSDTFDNLKLNQQTVRDFSPPKQDDMLQCPKCHLAFPADKHLDLLDHINDCC